jgi:hypothetical protein
MSQRIKPPAGLAFPGQTLTLEGRQVRNLREPPRPTPKRGKLDYLGGPKSMPRAANGGMRHHIGERQWLGQGRFIGGGQGRILAFVWLDDVEAPSTPAANDNSE